MLKPKLLCRRLYPQRQARLSRYFEIVEYNADSPQTSDKYDAVLADWNDTFFRRRYTPDGDTAELWSDRYVNRGDRVIIDHSYDSYISESSYLESDRIFVLRSKNFWWCESNIQFNENEYSTKLQSSNPSKFFLLLMNMEHDHRTKLFNNISRYTVDSLYSYVAKGILLPGEKINKLGSIEDQNAFVPDWYSGTHFSLVAETTTDLIRPEKYCPPQDQRIFISEKTFKPIAFKHPFIIFGTHSTLAWLKSCGFETFDHLINEDYDKTIDEDVRLAKILNQMSILYSEFKQGHRLFEDRLSKEKIDYNFNRFYNSDLVEQMYIDEIVNPMLEFVNA